MSSTSQRRWPWIVVVLLIAGTVAVFFVPVPGERSEGRPGPGSGKDVPAPGISAQRGAALARALDERDPSERARDAGRLLREWLEADESALIVHLRGMPAGQKRTEAVLLVLEEVARTDVRRALQLARELVQGAEERAFYRSLFARLAADDAAATVSHLSAVPPGESRMQAVTGIAAGWSRNDADAALAWAGKLPDAAERLVAREAILTELAATEPARAVRSAQQLLSGPALQRTTRAAFAKLTATDPGAAGELVRSLPAGETQTNAAVDVARGFAARQPAEAIAWTKTLADPNLQRLALHTALEEWAVKDAAAAGGYVAKMDPGPTQMSAADHVGRVMAATDPQKAIAWAQTLTSSSARDFALIGIASTWARRDPAEAVTWASGLPAGESRTQALGSALSYWALQDTAAAQKFVTGLKGELQVAAATALAPILAQSSPKAAAEWAKSLAAPEPRDSTLAAVLRRWREISAPDADAWLKSSNLPSATKAKLQKGK